VKKTKNEVFQDYVACGVGARVDFVRSHEVIKTIFRHGEWENGSFSGAGTEIREFKATDETRDRDGRIRHDRCRESTGKCGLFRNGMVHGYRIVCLFDSKTFVEGWVTKMIGFTMKLSANSGFSMRDASGAYKYIVIDRLATRVRGGAIVPAKDQITEEFMPTWPIKRTKRIFRQTYAKDDGNLDWD